jgi:hypothetical protein
MSTFSRNIIIQNKITGIKTGVGLNQIMLTVPTDSYYDVVAAPEVSGSNTSGDNFSISIDDGTDIITIYDWLYNGTAWINNFNASSSAAFNRPQCSPRFHVGPGAKIRTTITRASGTGTMNVTGVEFKNAVQ